jgi:hypothetical protein
MRHHLQPVAIGVIWAIKMALSGAMALFTNAATECGAMVLVAMALALLVELKAIVMITLGCVCNDPKQVDQ